MEGIEAANSLTPTYNHVGEENRNYRHSERIVWMTVAETLITLLDQTVTGIWSVVKRFEAILADSLDWHTRELEKQASVPMIERPLCS